MSAGFAAFVAISPNAPGISPQPYNEKFMQSALMECELETMRIDVAG